MSSNSIRAAVRQDIAPMIALLEELFSIEEDFYFSAENQQRGLEMLLASPSAHLLVATEGNQVVGMISAQLTISTAEGGPALLLEDLVLAPEARGKGTGRRLLEAAGDWGAQHGATRMQLLADAGNTAALVFYGHCSWHTTRLICLRKIHDKACP